MIVERDEQGRALCGCIECTNLSTHTWSGHPTCDSCGMPGRQKPPMIAARSNKEIVAEVKETIGWLRDQIGPKNADRLNDLLDLIQ